MENTQKKRKPWKKILIIVMVAVMLCSIAQNVYYAFWGFDSYLQSTEEIEIMEAGVLLSCLDLRDGEDHSFTYDFNHDSYAVLKEQYDLESIAGNGSELEKALNLMDEYSGRLTHKSDYKNQIELNALDLLDYSLDNKSHGINCRAKAQIFNEMCLSLGIYARKVWLMPLSPYDRDCHVVNEVWDTALGKWVMLDITNNQYWVDKYGTPLSVLEIRQKGAENNFCTPVCPGDNLKNLSKLKEKYIGNFVYIMKNMVYTEYCAAYGVGEIKPIYLLYPENLKTNYEYIIDLKMVECPPM